MENIIFELIKHGIILLTLIYASYIDIKLRDLKNHRKIYVPLIIFGFTSFVWLPWWIIVGSAAFAFAFAWVLKRFGLFGGADVKIFTLLAMCYPLSFILIIYISGAIAVGFGILMIKQMGVRTSVKMKLPYVPFIMLGTVVHNFIFMRPLLWF